MKTLDDKIEELNVKEQHKIKHIFTPNTNKNGTVQCRYDQTGFCIQREQCSYFHTSQVCAEFVVNGYCSQLVCCKRRPKYCRNIMQEECFWGQNCKYLHKEQIVTAIVANENCY